MIIIFYVWDKELNVFQYCVFFQSKKDKTDYIIIKDSDYFEFKKSNVSNDFLEVRAGRAEEIAFLQGYILK